MRGRLTMEIFSAAAGSAMKKSLLNKSCAFRRRSIPIARLSRPGPQVRPARFFTGSIARSEDLAQETFLVVIRGAERYEPRALVRTYLYAIALNLLMSERRKRAHDGPDLDSIAEPATHASAERDLWVRQGLQKLEETEREILMLREYEQLSYSDIAELLHLPLNTVRSRLFRARMALREHLAPGSNLQSAAAAADEVTGPRVANPVEGKA